MGTAARLQGADRGRGGFLPAYLVEVLVALNRRGSDIRCWASCAIRRRRLGRLGHLLGGGLRLRQHDVAKPLPGDLAVADFIVHAASQASPRYYGSDPVGTLKANALGTAYYWIMPRDTREPNFCTSAAARSTDRRSTVRAV